MKKILLAMVLSLVFGTSLQAYGAQVGVVLGGTTGSGENDGTDDYYYYEGDRYPDSTTDFDVTLGEIGFALNIGKTVRLVNYRLNVGIVKGSFDYDEAGSLYYGEPESFSADYTGFSVTNTLGFKVINQPGFRCWLGGSVYLGGGVISDDFNDDNGIALWGIGPTAGFDFDIKNGPTIGIEIGARFLKANFDSDSHDEAEINDLVLRFSLLWGN